MPRIVQTNMPRQFAREYFREIKRLMGAHRRQVWQAFQKEIRPRIHLYREMLAGPTGNTRRLRANDALDEVRDILARLRETAEKQIFSTSILERFARQFAKQTSDYSRINFKKQVSDVLGFDPTANEPWLESFLETITQENVKWIKSIATEYHNEVESVVLQGMRRGESITKMAEEIASAGDVSLSRARFIARDQVGSLYGELTKKRQESTGLERFRWSTSGDSRVRHSHEDLDGKIFTWADGALVDGKRIWPGTDYNCRCVAEVVFEDLLEVAGDE